MSLELELLDCNCNHCVFMQRDLDAWKKWDAWHRLVDETDFNRRKAKAIADAEEALKLVTTPEDKRSVEGVLRKAHKMKFQYDRAGHIQYGNCLKFEKPVTFIPDTCQLETQHCFAHRRLQAVDATI